MLLEIVMTTLSNHIIIKIIRFVSRFDLRYIFRSLNRPILCHLSSMYINTHSQELNNQGPWLLTRTGANTHRGRLLRSYRSRRDEDSTDEIMSWSIANFKNSKWNLKTLIWCTSKSDASGKKMMMTSINMKVTPASLSVWGRGQDKLRACSLASPSLAGRPAGRVKAWMEPSNFQQTTKNSKSLSIAKETDG
jgi:hypothetical protein